MDARPPHIPADVRAVGAAGVSAREVTELRFAVQPGLQVRAHVDYRLVAGVFTAAKREGRTARVYVIDGAGMLSAASLERQLAECGADVHIALRTCTLLSEPHKTARSFDIAPETTDAAQAHCAGAYAPVRLSASRQPSRPNTTIGRVAAIWPAFSMAARLAPSAAAQAVHPPTRRRVNTPTPSTPHRPRGLRGASRAAVLALSTPQPWHG